MSSLIRINEMLKEALESDINEDDFTDRVDANFNTSLYEYGVVRNPKNDMTLIGNKPVDGEYTDYTVFYISLNDVKEVLSDMEEGFFDYIDEDKEEVLSNLDNENLARYIQSINSYNGWWSDQAYYSEISDDTKQRVLAKRKANADKAVSKLNKSLKLMAKKDIGTPKEIKITLTYGSADVYKDSYEEGELGYVNSWNNDRAHSFTLALDNSLADTLADKMGEYLYCPWITKDNIMIIVEEDGNIRLEFGTVENEEGNEPFDSEWKDYKAGKINLYAVNASIRTEIAEGDKPYFIQACRKAGIDVEEW